MADFDGEFDLRACVGPPGSDQKKKKRLRRRGLCAPGEFSSGSGAYGSGRPSEGGNRMSADSASAAASPRRFATAGKGGRRARGRGVAVCAARAQERKLSSSSQLSTSQR